MTKRPTDLRQKRTGRFGLLTNATEAREQERARISRALNHLLGQRVAALRLRVQCLKDGDPADVTRRADELLCLLERFERDLDFAVWGLRHPASRTDGLGPALKAFVDHWSDVSRIPAEVTLNGFICTRPAQEVEDAVYRISQEALNNVSRHARAKRVAVRLEQHRDYLVLVVQDDGCGFKVERDIHRGLGFRAMRERAALVNGRVDVETSQGLGTAVIATVPIAQLIGAAAS